MGGVAARLDLLRSTGTRHAWRRVRQDRDLARLLGERGERITHALWTSAAEELGATVTDGGPGRLEFRRGDAMVAISGQRVQLDPEARVELAGDKAAVYRLLSEAGLPVPEHRVFDAPMLGAARSFLAQGPVPCVLKPAGQRGGAGVTGEIRTVGDLRRAVLAASRYGRRLLIERQISGDVFRLLVLDGQVLDTVRRLRPRITGDGRSTVEELIFAEYDRRIHGEGGPGLKPFVADLDCVLSLRRAGLSLRSVLPAGETVTIKTVTNFNTPADNVTLQTGISDELAAAVVAATRVLGLRFAGLDIVTTTTLAGLREGGGAIIDVNAIPGLHHHAHVSDPDKATRVAVPVLRALLESAEPAPGGGKRGALGLPS